MRWYADARLQNDVSRFAEQCFFTTMLFAHFLYKMISEQATNFTASWCYTAKIKASHDVLAREFLRQSLESLKGFLLALEIHAGILQLIVEIGLCHDTKVMALTSVLDVHNQLCSRRVSWKIADLEKRKITKNSWNYQILMLCHQTQQNNFPRR